MGGNDEISPRDSADGGLLTTSGVRAFYQRRLAVRLGDIVTVTDTGWRQIKGKIADLSTSSLALIVARNRRDLPESEVAQIVEDHRHTGAGAAWGLPAGAAVGAIYGASCRSSEWCGAGFFILMEAGLNGGVGAGIGAGVGAGTVTQHVVYQRPGSSARRVTVSPLATRERKGVALTLGF